MSITRWREQARDAVQRAENGDTDAAVAILSLTLSRALDALEARQKTDGEQLRTLIALVRKYPGMTLTDREVDDAACQGLTTYKSDGARCFDAGGGGGGGATFTVGVGSTGGRCA